MYNATFEDIGNLLNNNHLERGRLTAIVGLQHNFKTGLLVESLIRFADDNPRLPPEEVERLILISPANSDVMLSLLVNYIEKITGRSKGEVSTDDFLTTYFAARGYKLSIFLCKIPAPDMTMEDLRSRIDNTLKEGVGKLRLLAVDDLREIVPHEDHSQYRLMVRELRLIGQELDASVLFNQPLNSKAGPLLRRMRDSGHNDEEFLKEVSSGSFYEDCMYLSQEVDAEIYVHITRSSNDKKPQLIAMRGKNRSIEVNQGPTAVLVPFSETHTGLV